MSFSTKEVLGLLTELAIKHGPDLVADALAAEPRLREDPIRAADEEMCDAEADARRRLGLTAEDHHPATDPAPPPRPSER